MILSAAASLMGLLCFAVLFNVDRKGHRLGARWLALAKSTLNVHIMLLLFPFALLVPDVSNQARALIVLLLTAFSVVRQFVCWLSAWKMKSDPANHPVWRITWLLLVPVSAYAVLAYTAGAVLWGHVYYRHDYASLALIALLVVALRNSWNLVLQHAELAPDHESVGTIPVSFALRQDIRNEADLVTNVER